MKHDEQEMHELLCAYVLGEVTDDERARVEVALAQDASLREERERLEATIGLVQGVMGEPESLSDSATSELFEKAKVGVQTPIWSRPSFRIAAALLVMVGGALMFFPREKPATGSDDLAHYSDPHGLIAKNVVEKEETPRGLLDRAAEEPRTPGEGKLRRQDGRAEDAPSSNSADSFKRDQVNVLERLGEADSDGGVENSEALISTESIKKMTGIDGVQVWKVEVAEPSDEANPSTLKLGESRALKDLGYTGAENPSTSEVAEVFPEVRGEFKRADRGVLIARDVARDSRSKSETRTAGENSEDRMAKPGNSKLQDRDDKSGLVRGFPTHQGGMRDALSPKLPTGTYRGPGDSKPPGYGGLGRSGGKTSAEKVRRPASSGPAGPGGPVGPSTSARELGNPLLSNVIFEVQGPVNGVNLGFLGNQYYLSSTIEFAGSLPEQTKPAAAPGSDSNRTRLRSRASEKPLLSAETLHLRSLGMHRNEDSLSFADRMISECRPLSGEAPSRMFFRYWGDKAFEYPLSDPLSTFSIDVDTASFAVAREYLRRGVLPPKEAVRTEEFLNYFKADVPAPTESDFGIHTELAPSEFGDGSAESWMMRVVVRGREVTKAERAPLSLTFVVDTSGSMKEQNRMELVKHALRLLVTELDANDSIALVSFNSEARLVLPMISIANRGSIETAIHALTANGSTNAEAGLKLGYAQAVDALREDAGNRVIFLSDGVANVGITDQERIAEDVRAQRERGIYLNTIGVGMGNHNDTFLEQLANKGDGLCNYVNDEREAHRAIVENFTGAFETIASDVKIQVEFDPKQVESYRLLGYENRAIADRDFRNDAVDAGEVGAGHQVTALYELVRIGGREGEEAPLATVRLRWKKPILPRLELGLEVEAPEVTEIEHPVRASDAASAFLSASTGYRQSVVVAQFAEFLRRSRHARTDSVDALIVKAKQLELEMRDKEYSEFVALVEGSAELIRQSLASQDELAMTLDALRENHILRAKYEALIESNPNERDTRDGELIEEIELRNRELEERIRQIVTNAGAATRDR